MMVSEREVMKILKEREREFGAIFLECKSCGEGMFISTGLVAKLQDKEFKKAREWLREHRRHKVHVSA